MSERFTRREHIRRRAEFQRAYDAGVRMQGRYMTVIVLPNSLRTGRLGVVATRRLGGAVVRNRAKRLVRELFRRNKAEDGMDFVVIPRRELLRADFATLEADYRSLLRRRRRR
jgi:ribonuclease P protein component